MAAFTWGTPTQIKNMLDPTSSTDAATKNYVDIKSIAGSNTQVLFNKAGNIGASANLIFNSALNSFQVLNGSIVSMNIYSSGVITSPVFDGGGNNLSNIQGANVSGAVAFATTANTVAGSNVSGQVANALVAGTVYTNAQPNITSVGTLTSLTVTGNTTAGNVYANSGTIGASLLTGTLTTASQPNITSVGTLLNTTLGSSNSLSGGNLVSATFLTGTLTTASQPNITSVGTLSSLAVTANLIAGNIESNGNLKANTLTVQDTIINGNLTVTGTTAYADVSTLNVKDPVIELGGNPNSVALSSNDGKDRGTLLHYYTTTPVDAFMGWKNNNAEFTFASEASLSTNNVTIVKLGNVRAGNAVFSNAVTANYFVGNGSSLSSITGANVTGAVPFATTANAVAGANVSGAVAFATTANAVAGANVSGQVNFAATANAVAGSNVSGAVSFATTANAVAGANVSGTVANANYAAFAGNITIAAQSNITSVGTLTGLNVSNNVTIANNLTVNNNVTFGDSGSDSMNVNSQANFFNGMSISASTGVYHLNLTGTGAGIDVAVQEDTEGVRVRNSLNNPSGKISAKLLEGTLTTASQPNITQLGTLSSITVSSNIAGGNLNVSGVIIASGNITGGNLITSGRLTATGTITGGNMSTGGTLSVTGSATAGNLSTSGVLVAIGNSSLSNVSLSGLLTANGTITGSNLTANGTLSVTGNANVGNLGVTGLVATTGNLSAGNLSTTGALSVTGNVTFGSSTVLNTTNNLLTINASLIPASDITYDLGSNTKRWNDLYLSNSNIYIANASISASDTTITLSNELSANGITSSGNLSVSGRTNLNNIGNITINGGINGAVIGTDGAGNLAWITPTLAAGANTQIQFNDNGSFAGNAGFTFNKATGNLTATLLSGTITTVAQPNITSVGTLTSLNVTGNINTGNIRSNGQATVIGTTTVGNLSTGGIVIATGNVTGGNILTSGVVTATGNVSGGNITTGGIITATGNISGGNITTGGNIVVTGNITANNLTITKLANTGDLTSANITGSGFANITGNIITAGSMFANSGNIQGNNASITRTMAAGNITTTGNITASGNISTVNLSANGNVNLGAVANVRITGGTNGFFLSTNGTGTLSWASPSAAQGSNTQVQFNDAGTLGGSGSFTFNKTTGVVSATQFNGNAAGLTSIPGANVSGTVANATYAVNAGTVVASSQPNITSVGTLVEANVSGNINVTGNITVNRLTNLGNVGNVKITGGTDGYILKTDGAGNLSWIVLPDTRPGGTTTEVQFNDGNVFAGNSAFTFDKATGKVSATHFSGSGGNLTNLPAANLAGTIPAGVTFSGTVANATQANVANYAGIVTGNTQSNITAVGTLKRLRVSNSGFNEIDSFAITGSTQSGYFSTTDTSFWIISAANAVSATTGSIPDNPGSGFEISQDINQVTIINAGYQTITVNPHGDFKPKTAQAGGSLSNNLGGKAGGTDYVYDIAGTPAGNISYVAGTYWRVSQNSTSGSGTGALFEIITVPAIGGIAYSVIVNDPGTGYAQGDTVTILGANLGGATPANNLTFKVSQTWDAYWRNLYVGDVNMNNGTGDWTLMAGSNGLYLRNNANGNKYLITMSLVGGGVGPTPLG